MGRCTPAERLGERVGECDRVALDGDVDVEALFAEEDVADRAADEVDPVGALAQLRDRIGDLAEARTRPKLLGDALHDFGKLRRNALERAKKIGAADHADQLVVAEHGDAAVLGCRYERTKLTERRVLVCTHDLAAHDPANGRVGKVVADRLVEILATDAADEPALLGDEYAALTVPLAERHRVANAGRGLDRARGRRHHVTRERFRATRIAQRSDRQLSRSGKGLTADRRRRLCVAPAAERGGDRGRVDPLGSAPHDDEHALVHLDEEDECPRIGEIDDLVREVRHTVDVLRPADGCEQHVAVGRLDRLERVEQVLQETTLRWRERRVQVVVHQILARAVPEAP